MRRNTLIVLAIAMFSLAVPAAAAQNDEAIGRWLAGPDAGMQVVGSSGDAKLNNNGVNIKINAPGLEPGHAFTMWIAYFNDSAECSLGPSTFGEKCGILDVVYGKGGIAFGDGGVVGGSGKATFSGSVKVGDDPDLSIPGSANYEPSDAPYFVVIVRSKGPKIPGQVDDQIHSVLGGCEIEVGPEAGSAGGEIPAAPGECGDVQLFIFDSVSD